MPWGSAPQFCMILYHATLSKNLPSIQKNGLRVSCGEKKSYDGSDTKGLLFLADDWDIAYDFVEVAQMDWDKSEADEPIVVLSVDTENLVKEDLVPDRNVIFDDGEVFAFEYPHDIPAKFLRICNACDVQPDSCMEDTRC